MRAFWIGGVGAAFIGLSVLAGVAAGRGSGRTVSAPPLMQRETLTRGVVAVRQSDTSVFVGWRLLNTDAPDVTFNIYRAPAVTNDNTKPVRLNARPLSGATNFVDATAKDVNKTGFYYFVRPVVKGREQQSSAADFYLPPGPAQPYFSIPLQTLPGHTPNDIAVGDLDGDGELDFVVKQEMMGHDNSQSGKTGTTKLEGYKRDGTLLWRIDLGPNIREGAHYTPFLVYDFDGDGKAEVAVRTSEGTVDGTGNKIGDTDGDGRTEYVNTEGRILEGPEFLSVFDGKTGKEVARAPYIARGKVTDWGDAYGNRVDRFLMAVAFVDGVHPSIIACRGYYALTKLETWDFRNGQLAKRWAFSSGDKGNEAYAGQGNHNLSVADVNGDGRDDIIYGAMTLSGDGKGLYSTGIGHADALHVGDLDPDRPGLEVFDIQERFADAGMNFRDARTGEVLWKKPSLHPDKGNQGPGRGTAFDVDPTHRGSECWARGSGMEGVYDCKGNQLCTETPSCNMSAYWDGDALAELLDGTTIRKWDWVNHKAVTLLDARDYGCASNNGTKANPCLSVDLWGDWREEVIWRSADNKELRIFTSTIPTKRRMVSLLQDHVYRMGIAWQNVGYNQPPHLGFFLDPATDDQADRFTPPASTTARAAIQKPLFVRR